METYVKIIDKKPLLVRKDTKINKSQTLTQLAPEENEKRKRNTSTLEGQFGWRRGRVCRKSGLDTDVAFAAFNHGKQISHDRWQPILDFNVDRIYQGFKQAKREHPETILDKIVVGQKI